MSADTASPSAGRHPWGLGALLIGLAAGYLALLALFPQAFLVVGINHFNVWFLDSFALLASNDAVARGLDPYAANPLDYFQRPHVYSPWWLHLRDLGLTRADNFRVGLAIVAAFYTAALWRLRPRTKGELCWMLAVLCASPVVLAVNRANNDLVVFVLLSPVVPCVLSSRPSVRLIAAALLALGAGLKYYPAAGALVLLAGGDRHHVRGLVAVAAVSLGLVAIAVGPDFVRMAPMLPRADGLMTFGAVNLLDAAGLHGRAALVGGLLAGVALFGIFLRGRPLDGWKIAADDRAAWLSFVLGASLLAGCFFTGTNYAYRWIFALWLVPLLWRLPRDAAVPARVRSLARLTAGLLLIALWADAAASAVAVGLVGRVSGPAVMRWAEDFFKWEQPFTWALFACLLAFLAHFTRESVRNLRAQD